MLADEPTQFDRSAELRAKIRAFAASLAAGILIANAIVLCLVIMNIVQLRQERVERARISSQNISRILEHDISSIFDKINIVLLNVADDFFAHYKGGGIDALTVKHVIMRQHTRIPEASNLLLADAEGTVLFVGKAVNNTPFNISDRSYFTACRDGQNENMYISKPVQSRLDGRWVVVMARRISGKNGSFLGVVAESVALDYFAKLFAAVDIGVHGGISLRAADMGIIARHPAPQDIHSILGNKTLSPELRRLYEAGKTEGTFYTPVSWDNTAKIVSFRKIGTYPLYINVGIATEDYLAGWKQEAAEIILFYVAFLTATLVLSRELFSRYKREERSEIELYTFNQGLERRIAERTEELTKVNEQLRQEIVDHKRTEEAFRESKERFRSMVESTSDWVWEVDRNGVYTYASPKVKDLLGYKPEEVIGRSPFDLMPRDEAKRVAVLFEKIVKSQNPFSGLENVNRHKDGQYVVIETSGVPVFDAGGNFFGYRGIDRDTTDRKQAEQALKKSEERFRAQYQGNPVPTFTWQRQGDDFVLVEFNDAVNVITAGKVKEYVGRKATELYADRPEVLLDLQRCYREREVIRKDIRSEHFMPGRYIDVKYSFVPPDLVMAHMEDITDRKRMEDDLIRERNRLKSLLNLYQWPDMEVADISSFVIEECVKMTSSTMGFFGFINEDETVVQAHLWSETAMEGCKMDSKPEEFSLSRAGIWAEAVRKHNPLIVNDYAQPDARKKGCPAGHVEIRRFMSIPLLREAKAVAVAAVANKEQDYTEADLLHLSLFLENVWGMFERKRAEEALRNLNEQLERRVEERTSQLLEAQEELVRREKLSILGQLAGLVGHEIRNPLGVMSNAVYFLKAVTAGADDTVREYLDIIKQEIDNSQRIISDLLDFSRTRTPQITPTAVSALINNALAKCFIPENIQVLKEISEIIPVANIDPFQIGQVVQNIITNAVQAMPAGGTLTIAAQHVQGSKFKVQGCEDDNIEHRTLNLEPESGFIEISVSDTGEGISPENMDKLFQPLFTTKTKGIGLGLVVCKNLVEANGGRISVGSRLGKGTTFKVILPV